MPATEATHLSVEVRPIIPERLRRLEDLANDLYFSWDRRVRRVFRHLDEECWESCSHNPKVFLRLIPQEKLDAAARDPILLSEYRRALSGYDTYLEEKSHAQLEGLLDPAEDLVAYFSAEYGFHESFPIYSGGLGILAGDYCKAASNLREPLVAVGLLYHQGYFTQRIQCCGGQMHADYPYVHAADLPVAPALDTQGNEVYVHVNLPGREVKLKVWEAKAGHIRLFLLDSDVPSNSPEDRSITFQLYGGDSNTRIQQETVLGIGGVRALRALGLNPSVWHINEGHAAFLILERCLEYVNQGMDLDSAFELVAANTVFTTHTPVPAGHDVFNFDQMRTFFGDFLSALRIDESQFFALGTNPRDTHGFCMTTLALRGSRFRNGVSRVHGGVASEMEAYAWPQVPAEENPMGYVTNGVDVDTFLGETWTTMFDMYLGGGWRDKQTDKAFWRNFIDSIPNHAYLSAHQMLKVEMLEDTRHRLSIQFRRGRCGESIVSNVTQYLTPHSLNTLVIGFARRFATYKRATLMFKDLQRLARLINDPERPVLLLFAGKPHPNDQPGRQLMKEISDISMRPEFQGRIILLENYNLSMARKLMPGVDVWLNTPEYPKEACGTSGMKAAINGAINLSVLDGWWAEAYDGENGWAIVPHPELDPETRDAEEAMDLLDILEHQVIPLFYERNADGEPEAWINKSKTSMKTILPRFNAIRMAMDYVRGYYAPARDQGRLLAQDDAAGAKELARWRKKIDRAWPEVRLRLARPPAEAIHTGEPMPIEVAVNLNGLDPEDVVVECVLGSETELGEFIPGHSIEFTPIDRNAEGETAYHVDLNAPERSLLAGGLQHYRIRIYPYHRLLSHRFECGCMLWL